MLSYSLDSDECWKRGGEKLEFILHQEHLDRKHKLPCWWREIITTILPGFPIWRVSKFRLGIPTRRCELKLIWCIERHSRITRNVNVAMQNGCAQSSTCIGDVHSNWRTLFFNNHDVRMQDGCARSSTDFQKFNKFFCKPGG